MAHLGCELLPQDLRVASNLFQPGMASCFAGCAEIGTGVMTDGLQIFRLSCGVRDSERCKRIIMAMMNSSTVSKNLNIDSIGSYFKPLLESLANAT